MLSVEHFSKENFTKTLHLDPQYGRCLSVTVTNHYSYPLRFTLGYKSIDDESSGGGGGMTQVPPGETVTCALEIITEDGNTKTVDPYIEVGHNWSVNRGMSATITVVQFEGDTPFEKNPVVTSRDNLEVSDVKATSTGITYTITNTEKLPENLDPKYNSFMYGDDLSVEQLVNGEWKECYEADDLVNRRSSIGLLPNEPKDMNENWEHIYGTLPSGSYRLLKQFTDRFNSDFILAIEFEI